MKKLLIIGSCLLSAVLWAQKPVTVSSKVENATVYFDAVELTHKASINFTKGTYPIVIQNVSNTLDVSTVQTLVPKGVSILSTQFSVKHSDMGMEPSSTYYKQLKDSIALINLELKRIQNKKDSEQKTVENLDITQSELTSLEAINTAEYVKMVDFYTTKRTALLNSIDMLQKEEQKIKKIFDNLNLQMIDNFPEYYHKNRGEIVLRVMSDITQKADIQFTYVSRNASWYPSYDLRVDNIKNPLTLVYKAKVIQRTGVNWENVSLTLSSGSVGSFNEKPVLYPWHLAYYDTKTPHLRAATKGNEHFEIAVTMESSKKIYNSEDKGDFVDGYNDVNHYVMMEDSSLATSFEIKVKYDVQSNGKEHSVTLQELNIPTDYKYYATPRGKNAFLIAEIDNYSQYSLLSGEADVIIEGLYAGKTYLEPNQNQDKLQITMGVDRKIAISKEKVLDKSEIKFLSNYKEQVFTYDIVVRNNKKENVLVTLEDLYPLSTNKDITVELLETSNPNINNKEKGLLSWDVSLAPAQVKKIRISYKVKYPKDMVISNL